MPEDSIRTSTINKLIRRGGIQATREMIRNGLSLWEPPNKNHRRRRNALELAIMTGSHGMVEMLLEEAEWTEEELGWVLDISAGEEREDLVRLLLDHGAPWNAADSATIIMTMDEGLIDRFIDLGFDPCKGDAFLEALNTKRARPTLRLYKKYILRFPELQHQLNMALASATREKLVKWAILLEWAGGDYEAIPRGTCPC